VQLNVSSLDRVQRSSKGAIKRLIGNNFPHFQPQFTLQGYLSRADAIAIPLPLGTRGFIRFKISPKKFHSILLEHPGRGGSVQCTQSAVRRVEVTKMMSALVSTRKNN
jgi:hypothetical protein